MMAWNHSDRITLSGKKTQFKVLLNVLCCFVKYCCGPTILFQCFVTNSFKLNRSFILLSPISLSLMFPWIHPPFPLSLFPIFITSFLSFLFQYHPQHSFTALLFCPHPNPLFSYRMNLSAHVAPWYRSFTKLRRRKMYRRRWKLLNH